MRIVGRHDEAVLHALGASMCAEVRDESGEVIGHEVEPSIKMADYKAKMAELRANPPPPHEPHLSQDELRAVRELIGELSS